MALKVLLADDSMTAQSMGKKILSDAGYDVIAVSNGAAALKKVQSEKPDIAVLDVYMPGYSGLEVCDKIKNNPETAAIPVLLTVGKMEPFRPEEANRVKADGVMIKPFEASDLMSAIANICSLKPESTSASKTKNEKKPDSATHTSLAAAAPVKSHEDTIRLTREELKQIREASYQDWGGSGPASASNSKVEAASSAVAAAMPAGEYLEATSAIATAVELATTEPANTVQTEALNTAAADLSSLHSAPAASWEVGLPEFMGSLSATPEEEVLATFPRASDTDSGWDSPFEQASSPTVVDDIPEMPPLPAIDVAVSGLATDDALEAFSANVSPVADETADFTGPMPDLEFTAIQREHQGVETEALSEPELITNTDSKIAEFVTQFGVSTPATVSTDELHTYVAENNQESGDTFSSLLRNHHIATEIPEANLPDLVAEERERAEALSNPEASNETYAELMHSNDFDVQSLSELRETPTAWASEDPAAINDAVVNEAEPTAETYAPYTPESIETASVEEEAPDTSFGASFTDSTQEDSSQEAASQTGVFHDWQSEDNVSEHLTLAANSAISDAQVHPVSSFHPEPLIEASTPGVSDTSLAWETTSQHEVLVAQPQAESDLETESMTTESMKPSSTFTSEPLMSAVVENVEEIAARHPGLTEEAIARAFSRVLDRFKDQLVSELAKELTKE